MSQIFKNQQIPTAIIFVISILFVVNYFFPGTMIEPYVGQIGNWAIIIAAFAMAFGFLNLLLRHGRAILSPQESSESPLLSIWLIVIMLVTFAFGTYGGLNDGTYQWIMNNIYLPIGASFLSFAFIYMCSAAVRVMKLRNLNETLLGTVIALAGNIPLFSSYTNFFVQLKEWAVASPTRGTFTAFNISIALGVLLIGIRTMIGIERGWLGEDTEGGE